MCLGLQTSRSSSALPGYSCRRLLYSSCVGREEKLYTPRLCFIPSLFLCAVVRTILLPFNLLLFLCTFCVIRFCFHSVTGSTLHRQVGGVTPTKQCPAPPSNEIPFLGLKPPVLVGAMHAPGAVFAPMRWRLVCGVTGRVHKSCPHLDVPVMSAPSEAYTHARAVLCT